MLAFLPRCVTPPPKQIGSRASCTELKIIEWGAGQLIGEEGFYPPNGKLLRLRHYKIIDSASIKGNQSNLIENCADTSLHLLLLKSFRPRVLMRLATG